MILWKWMLKVFEILLKFGVTLPEMSFKSLNKFVNYLKISVFLHWFLIKFDLIRIVIIVDKDYLIKVITQIIVVFTFFFFFCNTLKSFTVQEKFGESLEFSNKRLLVYKLILAWHCVFKMCYLVLHENMRCNSIKYEVAEIWSKACLKEWTLFEWTL